MHRANQSDPSCLGTIHIREDPTTDKADDTNMMTDHELLGIHHKISLAILLEGVGMKAADRLWHDLFGQLSVADRVRMHNLVRLN